MVDHPDLPSWLLFTQKDLLSDGFLYGTPSTTEDSTSIQVLRLIYLYAVADFRLDILYKKSVFRFIELNVRQVNCGEIIIFLV